ncbi:MAG: hypothetical protein MUC90_06205 [Thermoplasmata archaeon]|nr:hypothetical protein [Thermoplasmata archaeon]
MEQDIKIETLIVMSFAIFGVLALVAFAIPFEDTATKLFFIGVVAALTAINVFGLFMVWRSSPTIVDEVFLMTTNGLLIKHYTRRLRPIMISHGKNIIVAAIISTKKPERLRVQLKSATEDIESQFGERIGKWGGDKKELGDVDLLMKKFLSGKYRR